MKKVLCAFLRCLWNNGAAYPHIPLHALLVGPVTHFFFSLRPVKDLPPPSWARSGSQPAPVRWLPGRRHPPATVPSSYWCQTNGRRSRMDSSELTKLSCWKHLPEEACSPRILHHLYSSWAAALGADWGSASLHVNKLGNLQRTRAACRSAALILTWTSLECF